MLNEHKNCMSKLRSDAIWNTLTPEQREQIEEWLIDENLSFQAVHERGQKELGLTCSLATVGRFYKHLVRLRAVDELETGQDLADELVGAGTNLEALRESSMKLLVVRLLNKALAGAEVKEVSALGRLMLMDEEREIRRDRVNLAREKFQFKAAKAALTALPLLDEMAEADEERELARIEAIKQKIFGKELARMDGSNQVQGLENAH
jgi:hypothetical protein